MPSGATIIAGQDTKTITVTFTSPGMGKNIFVSGNGISANHIVSVFAPISGTPVVNGPSSVCVSQSGVQFSLSNVTGNATGYSWVLPSGMTITSGASSANITVSTSSNFAGGQIIGYAIAGPCGSSPVGTKQISVASPLDTPGPITGPSTVDAGQSNVIYSVSPISGATEYGWTIPAGASISGGSTGSAITVNFWPSFAGGNISVRGKNSSCTGPESSPLMVSVNVNPLLPGTPGEISGVSEVCEGNNASFSIPPIPNATGYAWIPTGGPVTFVGGSNTNTVTINFQNDYPSSGIMLKVYGTNIHGAGPESVGKTIIVHKRPGTASSISGSNTVCPGTTDVYSVSPVANASSYVWSTPFTVEETSAPSYSIQFPISFSGGLISVQPKNGACVSSATSLSIAVTPLPGAAEAIAGATVVCQGQINVNYSVPTITNATEYVWTLPSGQQQVTSSNSTGVNYASNATSGILSVYGRNGICAGASSDLAITVKVSPEIIQQASYSTPSATEVIFSIIASGSGLTYQWRKNGVDIPLATGSTYIIDPARYSDEGGYSVVITGSNGCSVTSSTTNLSVHTIEDQTNRNYIIARTIIKDNVTSQSQVLDLLNGEVNTLTTYFDGLGRPIQTVEWKKSATGLDLITPAYYDAAGRESRKYLTFVGDTDYGWYQDVNLTSSGNYAGTPANTYNGSLYNNIPVDGRPFAETVFEQSPVNRPLRDYGVGEDWASTTGADKYIGYTYTSNVHGTGIGQEKIAVWIVNSAGGLSRNTAVSASGEAGYYPSGALSVAVIQDEHGFQTREYKTKTGRVVLKKVQAVENASLNNDDHWAQTYYIYDDFGNLIVVLPPEAVKALTD